MLRLERVDSDRVVFCQDDPTGRAVLARYMLPRPIFRGISIFIRHGQCGGFVAAVMRGDLFEAVTRADQFSLPAMTDIARFVYHFAPAVCIGQGSKDWPGKTDDERERVFHSYLSEFTEEATAFVRDIAE